MKFTDRVYIKTAGLIPRIFRNAVKKQLTYAGIFEQDGGIAVGMTALLSLLCLLIGVFVGPALGTGVIWWHVILGATAGTMILVLFYLFLYFRAADRSRKAEEALPDLLHLIASNLQAGMTPFAALKSAQRRELGPLADELRYATRRAFGNESFSDVLIKITERINSDTLDRVLRLFSTSLASGGHSAVLLQELARDIQETRTLKKEFAAATKTYSMFIFFTVVVGAPFLLNISIQFVNMMTKISGTTKLGDSAALGTGFFNGDLPISVNMLFWLSISVLVITSILASIMMSVIKEGKVKDGLRTAPFLAAASIAVFFISKSIISNLF